MNINIKENIKPISYIQTNTNEVFKYLNEHKNPIIITQNGEASGVLLDVESYQNMISAMSILKLLQISESAIVNNKLFKNIDVFQDLKKNRFHSY